VAKFEPYVQRILHISYPPSRHLPGEASYFARSSTVPLQDRSDGSKPVVLESACTVRHRLGSTAQGVQRSVCGTQVVSMHGEAHWPGCAEVCVLNTRCRVEDKIS